MHRDPIRRLALSLGYAVSAAADMIAMNLLNGFAVAGSTDWVPSKDQDLDAFCTNWDTLITAAPGTYGLQASDATAFHTQRLAFTNALAAAVNPPTRTEVTVAAKDTAKNNLKTLLRQQAGVVQANPAVLNSDKLALGLPIDNNTPAPIPAPVTMPLLNIVRAGVLTHELRFADELTPDSSRKPDGATALELHVEVSATVIADPAGITYRGLATRNPFLIEYDAADKGKQAYISGRWITRTGEVGPWSAIQQMTVAA